MKIALFGSGAMGKLVDAIATQSGHVIELIVDESDSASFWKEMSERLKGCDVAVDFTVAAAVRENVERCMAARVPLVEGTTGWNGDRALIERIVRDSRGSMVFGANFSIGVNLFYRIAEHASELISRFGDYEAFIEEQHHSRKLDAPSGTALKLKDLVSKHVDVGEVAATRAGDIPGTHRLGFDGPADQLLLVHTARSREGFARGALLAAEWIVGKEGFFEFDELLDEILRPG